MESSALFRSKISPLFCGQQVRLTFAHRRKLFSSRQPFVSVASYSSANSSTSTGRKKLKKPEDVIRKEISVVMAQLAKLSPASQQTLGSVLKKYVKKLGPECVLGTLWELIRKEDWSRAIEAFDTVRNQPWYEKDPSIYACLISVAGKAGQVSQAMELFKAMDLHKCSRTTPVYTSLIDVLGKNGRLNDARKYFIESKHIPGCEPDEASYCAILRTLCRSNALEEAEKLFQEMPANGCLPNQVAFNIMIDGYGRAGDIERMQMRFLEMCHMGLIPDSWTYNSLIRNFGKFGRIEDMEACFESMQANGCAPDQFTMQALIDGYAKHGHLQKMLSSMLHMLRRKYRVGLSSFNTVIDACGKARELKEMEYWYGRLKHTKLIPSVATFCSMAHAYGKAGKVSEVSRVVWEMKRMGISPDLAMYNVLIDAFGCVNDMKRIEDLKEELIEGGIPFDSGTYTAFIVAYGKGLMLDEMEQMYSQMLSAGLRAATRTYNGLMSAYSAVGDPEKVRKAWRALIASGSIPDAESFRILIETQCKAGDFAGVKTTVARMRSSKLEVEGVTCNCIVESLAAAENIELMEEYLSEMSRLGSTPTVPCLNEVISAYGKQEMKEKAFAVFDFILSHDLSPQPATIVALIASSTRSELLDNISAQILEVEGYRGMTDDVRTTSTVLLLLSECSNWNDARLLVTLLRKLKYGRFRPVCRVLFQGYSSAKTMAARAPVKIGGSGKGRDNLKGLSPDEILASAQLRAMWQDLVGMLLGLHKEHKEIKSLEPFYSSLVAALLNFGLRQCAIDIVKEGYKSRVLTYRESFSEPRWELSVNLLKPPVSGAVVLRWIQDCHKLLLKESFPIKPNEVCIRISQKQASEAEEQQHSKFGVLDVLLRLESPFPTKFDDGQCLIVSGDVFEKWIHSLDVSVFSDAASPHPGWQSD